MVKYFFCNKNNINKLLVTIFFLILIPPPFNSWFKIFFLTIFFYSILFFKFKKKNFLNRFNLFFLIGLIALISLPEKKIFINHIVLPTVPQKGLNYVKKNLPKNLGDLIQPILNNISSEEINLKYIHQPYSKKHTNFNNFAVSAEKLWNKNFENGKYLFKKNNLTFWDFGPISLNDRILNFGNKKKINYNNNLIFPTLIYIDFKKNIDSLNFCYKGFFFYNTADGYKKLDSYDQKKCINLQSVDHLYILDTDRKTFFDIEYNNIFHDNYELIINCLKIILLFFLFRHFFSINTFYLSLSVSFYLVLFLYIYYGLNALSGLSENIYLSRGMDGMAHFGYSRIMLISLFKFDFIEALRGSEDVFYYMPLMRYLNLFFMLIFGDNLLGPIFIISFIPMVIFQILKKINLGKYSYYLTFIFLFLPIFEAFGFTSIYFIKYTIEGYGEGLAYFFLLIFFLITFKERKKNFDFFILGFLSFLVIGLRPNYSFFFLTYYIFYYFYHFFIIKKNISNLFFLSLGASLVFLYTFHNIYFDKKFTLLVDSQNILNSMKVSINDYKNFFINIFNINSENYFYLKIVKHLETFIKYYEFWFVVVLINNFYLLFEKKIESTIKIYSLALFVQLLTFLFFLGDPRYSMGFWIVSLILLFYSLNKKDYFIRRVFSNQQ